LTIKPLAVTCTGPKETSEAPVKPVPLITTVVPPSFDPDDGLTPNTCGPLVVGVTTTFSLTSTEAIPPFEVKLITAE
jgi:hypothetical protein